MRRILAISLTAAVPALAPIYGADARTKPAPRPASKPAKPAPKPATHAAKPPAAAHPAPAPGTGNQPASGNNQPASGNQPATGNQPASGQPASGNQPATGNQPASGNQPATGNQPVSGNQPATGNQPASGNQPATGNQPASGNQPGTGEVGQAPQADNTAPGAGQAQAAASDSQPAGPEPAEPSTDLILRVTTGKANAKQVTLRCDPPGGSHPKAAQACADLAKSGGDFTVPTTGKSQRACFMIYSPVRVSAEGRWQGEDIQYSASFPNTCVMHAQTGAIFDF